VTKDEMDPALEMILEQGDESQCLEFFQGMPEKRRRSLAPHCHTWHAKVRRNLYAETSSGTITWQERLLAAETAVFATATLAELHRLPLHSLPGGEITYQILLDRRPAWTNDWVLRLLEEQSYWFHWRLIRDLMAAGLIDKPDHPQYYLGMISGIVRRRGGVDQEGTIEQYLLKEPDLLEDEVWRLFELEGGGVNSLANYDRFDSERRWSDALLALMKQGKLPRDRLLQCTLDALERDFNHYRAKWFASFHDALKPSPDELTQSADRYLRLLGASASNIASWALSKVEKVARLGVYEPRDFMAGLQPALEAGQKGLVKKGLKLLAQVAKQSPSHSQEAVVAATVALGHEDAEVQAAALDFVDRFGTPSDQGLISRIAEYAPSIAPSLRGRLDGWLPAGGQDVDAAAGQSVAEVEMSDSLEPGDDSQSGGLDPTLSRLFAVDVLQENLEQQRLEIPAVAFDGMDLPRLITQQRLEPIVDLDELIDVCARVVEDGSLVDDAERALDGLARLCGQKPADFELRTGPLRKRATQRLKTNSAPFCGWGPDFDVCGIVYAWLTGRVIRIHVEKKGRNPGLYFEVEGVKRSYVASHLRQAIGFFSRRSLALADQIVAGKSRPLLSAPTHAGGWISADELVRRVNEWPGGEPLVADVCLALLRSAPDGRGDALKQLTKATEEWKQAVRYGLGGPRGSIGPTAAYWVAAARARSPWATDPDVAAAFPDSGPDAAEAATYRFYRDKNQYGHDDLVIESQPPVPKKVEPDCVTVILHAQRRTGPEMTFDSGTASRSVGSIRWTATVWPQARESYFANAARDLVDNVDWWEARWENKALLEPLLDPGMPLGTMSLLTLAVALASKEPGEYGLATDIAIGAMEQGRLVSGNFGPILAELLPTGLLKLGRWHKTLSDIARVSAVHALTVQQSLQRTLRGEPDKMPRDFAKLLDLLKELSIELGQPVSDEQSRAFLARVKATGRIGKIAKSLLDVANDDGFQSGRQLMLQALDLRRAAARRFDSEM
jgi:hypothetical protein